jgi:hypothetical protein
MTGSVASVKVFLGHVFGEQGDVARIRMRVAQRTEGQEYPGGRTEPGADRHTGFPANRQGDEADVRIPDPAGKRWVVLRKLRRSRCVLLQTIRAS